LPKVRDLFFDEFFTELERVAGDIEREEKVDETPLLNEELSSRWRDYKPDLEDRKGALISVDGGVQFSNFAFGDFIVVSRACALVHWPGHDVEIFKTVKIHVDKVYDNRDRGFIPSYVRMITEYRAAFDAAKMVLDKGGEPIVVMDGSLYFGRFPYAIREYLHHPDLLAELFESISRLRILGRDHGFPVVGLTKDSTVFYLYMTMLRQSISKAGLGRLSQEIESASSPMNLRLKAELWPDDDKIAIQRFLEKRPLCDAALVRVSNTNEGYTWPLLLAPSVYYGRDRGVPSFLERIRKNIGPIRSKLVTKSLSDFFKCPSIALTYWKPIEKCRPFRIDFSASSLGLKEPWEGRTSNRFVESETDLKQVEKVLNHLGYWFVNQIEYNMPLKQADMLARFDRELYRQKYEPFIVKRLEELGLHITDSRRDLRELD
jgi:hypothetical protein